MTPLFDPETQERDPIRTLVVRASASYDSAALVRAGARAAAARGGGSSATRTYSTLGEGSSENRCSWRIWWERPSRWRDEFASLGGQADVSVVTERGSLVYLPGQQLMYTNMPASGDAHGVISARPPVGIVGLPSVESRVREFPLLAPALPDSEWSFNTLPYEDFSAGHLVRRVRAIRHSPAFVESDSRPSGYWLGVDEYECLVDDGRHMLLRITGIVEGEPVASVWLDDVIVNEPIPEEVFSFIPPLGTQIMHVS